MTCQNIQKNGNIARSHVMMGKTRRRMSMRMRTNSTGHMVVITFSSTQPEKMKIL